VHAAAQDLHICKVMPFQVLQDVNAWVVRWCKSGEASQRTDRVPLPKLSAPVLAFQSLLHLKHKPHCCCWMSLSFDSQRYEPANTS